MSIRRAVLPGDRCRQFTPSRTDFGRSRGKAASLRERQTKGQRQEQKQIPCGNDNKGKGNKNDENPRFLWGLVVLRTGSEVLESAGGGDKGFGKTGTFTVDFIQALIGRSQREEEQPVEELALLWVCVRGKMYASPRRVV